MLKESLTAKEQRAAILQTEVLYLLSMKCNRNIKFIASIKVVMCLIQVCVEGKLLKNMINLKHLKCQYIWCIYNFGSTPALILEFLEELTIAFKENICV